MRFSKRELHFLFLSFLCWRNRNRKKKNKKMEKAKKPYKNRFFKVVMQKVKNQTNRFFAKIA